MGGDDRGGRKGVSLGEQQEESLGGRIPQEAQNKGTDREPGVGAFKSTAHSREGGKVLCS